MSYTLSSAAKAVGVSKATIHRAVKSGKLSATRLDDGTYRIDPAELARAFHPASPEPSRQDTTAPPANPLETENLLLRSKVEMLTALLDREREATAELRQVIALLPKPIPQDQPKGRSFLARLLGR